mmetsp:Transcript_30143/g.94179  ORF Transcript_30143/g.94179 Transcript_30143/m.94179 type:complete len:303 (+) Transcript_30143:567-1475(+)
MPWSGLSRRRDELGLGQRGQRRVDQERVAVLGEDGVGRRTRLPAVGVNRVRRQRVLGREAERLILERELHRLIVCVHRHDGNRPVWVVEADGVEVRQLWDLRREAELRIGRPNREGTLQQRLALPVAAEKEGLVASAVTEARRQLRGDHLEAGVEVDRPPLRFDGGEAPLHLSPAPSGDPRTSSLYPPFTDCTSHFWFPRPPWSASPPSPHAHNCTFGNQHPGMMQSSTHSPPRWYPSEPGASSVPFAISEAAILSAISEAVAKRNCCTALAASHGSKSSAAPFFMSAAVTCGISTSTVFET